MTSLPENDDDMPPLEPAPESDVKIDINGPNAAGILTIAWSVRDLARALMLGKFPRGTKTVHFIDTDINPSLPMLIVDISWASKEEEEEEKPTPPPPQPKEEPAEDEPNDNPKTWNSSVFD